MRPDVLTRLRPAARPSRPHCVHPTARPLPAVQGPAGEAGSLEVPLLADVRDARWPDIVSSAQCWLQDSPADTARLFPGWPCGAEAGSTCFWLVSPRHGPSTQELQSACPAYTVPPPAPWGVAPAALGQVGSSLTGPGCASVSEKLWQRGVHDEGHLGHAGFGEACDQTTQKNLHFCVFSAKGTFQRSACREEARGPAAAWSLCPRPSRSAAPHRGRTSGTFRCTARGAGRQPPRGLATALSRGCSWGDSCPAGPRVRGPCTHRPPSARRPLPRAASRAPPRASLTKTEKRGRGAGARGRPLGLRSPRWAPRARRRRRACAGPPWSPGRAGTARDGGLS